MSLCPLRLEQKVQTMGIISSNKKKKSKADARAAKPTPRANGAGYKHRWPQKVLSRAK